MSTDTEYRFPTIEAVPDSAYYRPIPVLPEGEIYDAVKADLDVPDIEEIMARPSWSFEEADERLRPLVEKAMAKVAKANGDRTKIGPTPKRTDSSPHFQQGSEGGCYS